MADTVIASKQLMIFDQDFRVAPVEILLSGLRTYRISRFDIRSDTKVRVDRVRVSPA